MNELFKADYYRMTGKKFSWKSAWKDMIFSHNLRYMYWWRKAYSAKKRSLLAKWKLYRYSCKYGLEIGSATIGQGLYLGHPYNITVNQLSTIGNNVNLHKGVTIGMENRGERRGAPAIGNKVYIGVNATIVGKVKIGNNVLVAPNTYINFDVPDNSIVIGNPGKIIPSENATEGYICFVC